MRPRRLAAGARRWPGALLVLLLAFTVAAAAPKRDWTRMTDVELERLERQWEHDDSDSGSDSDALAADATSGEVVPNMCWAFLRPSAQTQEDSLRIRDRWSAYFRTGGLSVDPHVLEPGKILFLVHQATWARLFDVRDFALNQPELEYYEDASHNKYFPNGTVHWVKDRDRWESHERTARKADL